MKIKLTTGLSFLASASRSALVSLTAVAERPVGAGAKAHADAIVAAKMADFMVFVWLFTSDNNAPNKLKISFFSRHPKSQLEEKDT